MSSCLLDDPKLFRHVLEDLPVGICVLDREQTIRFWNHGAEQLTGHPSYEVVGHLLSSALQICNSEGEPLTGERCPVTRTISRGKPQQYTASSLHKEGHRVTLTIRTQPIFEHSDSVSGAAFMFEEANVDHMESSSSPMYGCLDAATGIPSQRLTRAVMNECIAATEKSRLGFGLLLVRLPGLQAFRAKHGPQSIVPFVRTAAHTLRHSLDPENFLGCWEENEFLAVLPSASPVAVATTAETLRTLLSHSEVSWWGDRFPIVAEVAYTVATASKDLESLLREMKPSHPGTAMKTAASAAIGSANLRG